MPDFLKLRAAFSVELLGRINQGDKNENMNQTRIAAAHLIDDNPRSEGTHRRSRCGPVWLAASVFLLWTLGIRADPPAGTLDTTFGQGGIAITNIRGKDFATSVALQSDGKIVAAGASHNGSKYDFAVTRYNIDGSLDTSFNGTGKVITSIGPRPTDPYGDKAYGVAVQSDGKILVAGSSMGPSFYADVAIVRYNADGALDTTFNGTGIVTTDHSFYNDFMYGLIIQPDGKIVVGGHSNDSGSHDEFEVFRYNPDGSLDTSFNGSGVAKADIGGANLDDAFSIALQPDGKFVLSGLTYAQRCCRGDFATARFNSDGTLDTAFNGTGSVITTTETFFQPETDVPSHGITVQDDGKIVVAGFSALGTDGDFTLVRYNADGTVDTGFHGTGTTTEFGSGAARSVAMQEDGKIVAVGSASNQFALGRYNSDGSLDTSFNGTGKVTTSIRSSANAYAIMLQNDGKIVVAGSTYNSADNTTNFALARYHPGALVVPTSVVSRKFHGSDSSAPYFDIQLPLGSNSPGVECRRNTGSDTSGPNAGHDHELIVAFTSDVTVGGGVDIDPPEAGAATLSVTANVVAVELTNVPNASEFTVNLRAVSDGSSENDVAIPMAVLLGDTTGGSSVNSSDVSQTKSQSGKEVTQANFRQDVTISGSINSSDVSLVKSKSGTGLNKTLELARPVANAAIRNKQRRQTPMQH